MKQPYLFIALLLASPVLLAVEETQYGHFRGRIVLQGEVPIPKPIKISKDVDAFSDSMLVDESLVVNPKNKGIANIVVYLLPKRGEMVKPHPAYEMHKKDKIDLKNVNGRFEPHVVLLRTTQSMVVTNEDTVGHNTRFTLFANEIP